MRGPSHHHCWQADCHDQLQDLDLDARHHLDQHLLLHSLLDFDQQALHHLFDQALHNFEQVIVDQLPKDHFFQADLDSLQLHQGFLDQLQVHDIVQVVDQLQVYNLVQVVQHTLHNLFVVLDQALRVQLEFFEVHKQQALHLVLPGFDFDFHQLDLHHRDCSGLPCRDHIFGLPIIRLDLSCSAQIFEHPRLDFDCWYWPPNLIQQIVAGIGFYPKPFEEHLRLVHPQDNLHRLLHQADCHADRVDLQLWCRLDQVDTWLSCHPRRRIHAAALSYFQHMLNMTLA